MPTQGSELIAGKHQYSCTCYGKVVWDKHQWQLFPVPLEDRKTSVPCIACVCVVARLASAGRHTEYSHAALLQQANTFDELTGPIAKLEQSVRVAQLAIKQRCEP